MRSRSLPPIFLHPQPESRRDWTAADVTVVVKSFLRFDCLRRCLDSLRFFYPGLPVIVVDDSLQPGESHTDPDAIYCRERPGVHWIELPFDSGVSAGRNAGVEAVRTKLVWLIDDDHVITDETRLSALLDVLNADRKVQLVCGVIREVSRGHDGATASNWAADLALNGGVLSGIPLRRPWQETRDGTWYRRADRFINMFLAPRDVLQRCPWGAEHKIAGEHLDHVLRLWDAGIGVAYTPNCIAGEINANSAAYRAFRCRSSERQAEERWGVTEKAGLWRTFSEPGIARRPTVPPASAVPPIVLLTPGHTGSSVTAGLLSLLGWHLPDNDPEFNEPRHIRELNDSIRMGFSVDLAGAIAELPRPWLLKDPRFCETLEHWLPHLAESRPLLLWLDRDPDAVRASWQRRGESLELLDRRVTLCERHWRFWPWAKTRVRLEDLAGWALSIEPARASRIAQDASTGQTS